MATCYHCNNQFKDEQAICNKCGKANVVFKQMDDGTINTAWVRLKIMQEQLRFAIEHNSKGEEFEKAGVIDKAIKEYELVVESEIGPGFPYERLRIIYTKQKNYIEAIRVCELYKRGASQYGVQLMDEHIDKLRKKIIKLKNP
jgi:tetratricopeptide (TPR) repeat protein